MGDDAVPTGENNWYEKVIDKDGVWVGIYEWHRRPDGRLCCGWARFNVPSEYTVPNSTSWDVLNYEPLTLTPSLLCRACGSHGFIQGGKWVPA